MENNDYRKILINLLDAMANQNGIEYKDALEKACLVSGRYCEPYISIKTPVT